MQYFRHGHARHGTREQKKKQKKSLAKLHENIFLLATKRESELKIIFTLTFAFELNNRYDNACFSKTNTMSKQQVY